MTASHALSASTALNTSTVLGNRHAPVRGVELLVLRLSLAGIRWARRRADRSLVTRDELAARRAAAAQTAHREHEFARRAHRLTY